MIAKLRHMDAQLIESLREFVSYKSISSDSFYKEESGKALMFLKNFIESLGGETLVVPHPNSRNSLLMGKIDVEGAQRTLLIYGHYDVQPANLEDGWDTEPFDLTEKDGYLYGRGATDDKGPITATLHAVKELVESGKLKTNLRFIYEGEEESGSTGFEEMVQANKSFLGSVDGIVIMDNYWLTDSQPCLTYGVRGLVALGITVSGPKQDLHSGIHGGAVREPLTDLIELLSQLFDQEGRCAIEGFYDTVAPLSNLEQEQLEKIQYDLDSYAKQIGVKSLSTSDKIELLKRRWREPTFSIHGFDHVYFGKGTKTVIPAKAEAKVSMRIVPDQKPEEIAELAVKAIKQRFETLNSSNELDVVVYATGDWWLGDTSNFLFTEAHEAIKTVWGMEPVYTREGGSIPIIKFMEDVFNAPAMMLPIGQSSDSAHSQNERIRIENLLKGKEVMKHLFSRQQ